jgi:hypothetical protein
LDEFGAASRYEVLLTTEGLPIYVVTKIGEKPVGAIFRSNASSGTLLLLPDIDFEPETFTKIKNGTEVWTSAASQFAAQLVSAVVSLDRALKAGAEVSAEPSWASDLRYSLPGESALRTDLLSAETQVEQAQKRKEEIAEALKMAGASRALLFEKGKPLERAIIDVLKLLRFFVRNDWVEWPLSDVHKRKPWSYW